MYIVLTVMAVMTGIGVYLTERVDRPLREQARRTGVASQGQ
jgi:hypothetical protein